MFGEVGVPNNRSEGQLEEEVKNEGGEMGWR